VSALGVGTNRWGARGTSQDGLAATYRASLDAGVSFFDTAEVYAGGRSERHLGRCARGEQGAAVLASKFAPLPFRVTPARFRAALDRTLDRLGRESIDLYYLHFPYSPRGVGTWMTAMALAVRAGKIRAVGVSNCSAAQMRQAAAVLGRHDVPLAANQVHYSLVHRRAETNGVLDACRELDVALVAYRPLAGGVFRSGDGPRDRHAVLFRTLGEIGQGHGSTVSQVTLSWLLGRDDHVVPIPGSTKETHARENAAALSLVLTEDELSAIDRASGGGG
jgi:aryl-alcohol dehydrogenase-like predicted oxidoreductase